MSWQTVMVLQVMVGTGMTLFSRIISLKHKRSFYLIGFCVYLVVGLAGIFWGLLAGHGTIPVLPNLHAGLLLLGVGFFIPISWLLSYRLLTIIGAANSVIAGTSGFVMTAVFAVILLGEPITHSLVLGGILLVTGTYLAFTTQASLNERGSVALSTKTLLFVGSSATMAVGLLLEKEAITSLGVWNYGFYGWPSQFLGACMLIVIFGRHELKHAKPAALRDALVLGLLVATSGTLYIYAVSIGTLSGTVLAGSAKVTLTVVMAAILLHERQNLLKRGVALVVSLAGLWLVLT